MSTVTRFAAIVAVATFGVGVAACSADVNSTTPDGGSSGLNIDVSLPDISLPDLGNNNSGNSGGDSGSSGGDSGSSGNGGGDSGSGGDSGNSGGGGGTSGSTGTSGTASNSSMGPLGWAVIAIGAIAVIALFMASSNSGDRQAAADDRRRRRSHTLNGVVQNARWAESQASQALAIHDSRQLQSAWQQARSYMPDVETAAAGLATDIDDADLASAVGLMGQNVASLRGAMDQYVQVRAQHDIDDSASTGAEQTVRQAMSSLDHSVQRVSDLTVAQQQ